MRLRPVLGGRLADEAVVDQWPYLIGRARDCHLRIDCPRVSRHHCQLVADGHRVVLVDLESRNGTFVNGEEALPQRRLASGDRLALGFCVLEVMIDPTAVSRSGDSEFDAHTAEE
ncbi:MAG: FHA domain-containing protein, partial [Pirellulales bacterium]